jgi:hypothetical protein
VFAIDHLEIEIGHAAAERFDAYWIIPAGQAGDTLVDGISHVQSLFQVVIAA